MAFSQEKHTDPALSDPAAYGEGDVFFQNGLLERKLLPLLAACDGELFLQCLGIHPDAHGGKLESDLKHREPDQDVSVQAPPIF